MKYGLTAVLVFLIFPHLLNAQDLEKRISLHVRDKAIGGVIAEIGDRSGIRFSYNPAIFSEGRKISLKVRNTKVRSILDEVLSPAGISWIVVENQVVLRKAAEGTAEMPFSPGGPKQFTIRGFLKEKSTGEVLIGANIYARGTNSGSSTNGYGFYSLTLPQGQYTLVISFLGYRNVERVIRLNDNMRISVEMEPSGLDIREVEIVSGNQQADIRNNQLSDIRFSHQALGQLPGFTGDLDIIRAMQSVPGIQSFGDGSALYFVRGGNYDQNLLLIDEVPIYNPSHLFGFYSAIAPDAINDVQIYKGDFPARYGGRLSSIVDIKAREGNLKRFGFSGNIGPYTSNLTVEGPIVKDRGSFLLSGRVSTVNWINYLTSENRSFDFMFFDINAKLNYKINDNNRVFFTFYTGRDEFSRLTASSVKTFGISWDNLAATFRWNHIFNSRLFSNTTVNYSRYNYYLFLSQQQDDYWGSSVSNLTAKTDFAWYLNPSNTVRMGAEVTAHKSDPGNVEVTGNKVIPPAPQVPKYRSMEYVFYAGNEQRIGKKVSVRYGIRLPVWQNLGPTTVYYFDVNHQVIDTSQIPKGTGYATFFSPEPRFNIQVALDGKSAVKASYSRTSQFIQILSNSVSPFTSLEVWVPAGPNIKPQKADQAALGYFRQVSGSNLNLSVEAFYKRFYNHIDYADHASLLYNPLLEGEMRTGDAWSYGIEMMLRKTSGKLTGWIGYTWSRAMIRTPEVNGGGVYPATWDRPHDVCVNVAYDTKKRWAFAANWILMTGGAITTPIGFFYNNGTSVPIYGERNNDRLPSYHRLDLSMSYAFSKPERRYQHKLIVTLYNAYGRLNPFSVSFNKIMNDNGEFLVPSNLDGDYELVPTTISVAGIIPSINYQFRF